MFGKWSFRFSSFEALSVAGLDRLTIEIIHLAVSVVNNCVTSISRIARSGRSFVLLADRETLHVFYSRNQCVSIYILSYRIRLSGLDGHEKKEHLTAPFVVLHVSE